MADEKVELTTEEREAGVVDPETTVGDNINLDSAVNDLASSLKLADAPVEEKPDGEQPTGEQPPAAGEAAPAPAPAAAGVEDRVPDTWRKEAQEKWATVDPVVKAEIRKREEDIARYVGEAQPLVAVGQGFSKILGPFAPIFEQYKVNPFDHINGLLHAHYNILFGDQATKLEMVRRVCRDAGINPAQLVDPNAKAPEQNELVQQFNAALAERDRVINELRGGVTGVTTALQEARANELVTGIMAFRDDTEAHPFFDEVIDDCRDLIDRGAARSLQEAYDIAVARNPSVRARQQMLEKDKQAAATKAAQATKAAAARKATAANVVSRTSGRPPAGEETIEQTLRSGLAKIHEREGR